ncbi:MAG: S41 family peptidase [Chloroflexi bacterium]|nr:S41 family peptidase [Chloroflexota bacterium]
MHRRSGDDGRDPGRSRAWLALGTAVLVFLAGVGFGSGGVPGSLTAVGAVPSFEPEPEPQPEASASGIDQDLLDEAVRIVVRNFVDPDRLDEENLTRGAIRGMVEALGDAGHTMYLTPEEVAAELQALDGRLTGIGVMVDTRAEVPTIIAVFPDSPAQRAGIRVGDTIVSVDGERADRLTISELLRRVRGRAGTTVVVGVLRADGTREELTMVRAEIDVPAVSWAMVPGTTIADVRLVQFQTGAADQLQAAVRAAIDAGATGMVLDLRGNPGGLVDEAVRIAGTFLPEGSVVFQEQDRTEQRDQVRTRGTPLLPDLPLVVLVDGGSASSSEIVAGALQDAGRAQVLGTRTFGTGTVLNFFPLSDGSAIRLGVIEWLTPDGAAIFETGIGPDVEVALPRDGTMLSPVDLDRLDRRGFRTSTDAPLRRAVRILRDAVP